MLYQTLTVFTVLCFLVYFNHRCNSKHSVRKAIAHTGALFCSSWYDSEHLDPQYFHSLVLLQNGIVRLEHVFLKKKNYPYPYFLRTSAYFLLCEQQLCNFYYDIQRLLLIFCGFFYGQDFCGFFCEESGLLMRSHGNQISQDESSLQFC